MKPECTEDDFYKIVGTSCQIDMLSVIESRIKDIYKELGDGLCSEDYILSYTRNEDDGTPFYRSCCEYRNWCMLYFFVLRLAKFING